MTKVKVNSKIEDIEKAYLDWLCAMIKYKQVNQDYLGLALELHNKEFYSILPNDDNRAIDGMKLRECFADERDIDFEDTDYLTGPCSMLEMMIALSQRMDFVLSDSGSGDRTAKWFWVLIRNLRLNIYSRNDLRAKTKRRLNDLILKKLVDRQYEPTGKGGLFPLKNPVEDQRRIEIWYQMMRFIDEMGY
ncbi:MAG: hypothetical protein ACHQUC_09245 [Chlamydiales bacterium]